jgi:hypothetical protein
MGLRKAVEMELLLLIIFTTLIPLILLLDWWADWYISWGYKPVNHSIIGKYLYERKRRFK